MVPDFSDPHPLKCKTGPQPHLPPLAGRETELPGPCEWWPGTHLAYPGPEHMGRPEPGSPLLHVRHQDLGIELHIGRGDGLAHVGVYPIWGRLWEDSHAVPVKARPAGEEGRWGAALRYADSKPSTLFTRGSQHPPRLGHSRGHWSQQFLLPTLMALLLRVTLVARWLRPQEPSRLGTKLKGAPQISEVHINNLSVCLSIWLSCLSLPQCW